MKRVILLLFLFISSFCSAQIYKYISVENGLSSRMVYSIEKDKKGYMWFLTYDGIDRFDGKLFKHYKLIANGIEINSSANFNQLYADTTGCMWEIGKDGQIFKFNPSTDSFQFICKLYKQHNDYEAISYAYIDLNNNIWLFTNENLFTYNIDSNKLNKISTFHNQAVSNMVQTGPKTYCFGTENGIYTAKFENNNLQKIPQPQLGTFKVQVNTMYYHEFTKRLYIGSFQNGLYIYDFTSRKLIYPDTGLQDININSITALNNNEILVATDGAGVYKINAHTFESKPYIVADYNVPNRMNGNNIGDILVDKEQRIWMANYPVGITVLNNRYPSFKWIKHSIGNEESLINDQVNSIIEDSEGDIWYATSNGISLYHTKTNTWTNLLSSFQSDTHNKNHIFITLCEVAPGIIMVGGYTSGMYWINKKDMKPIYFVPKAFHKNIFADKYIRAIYKDKQGYIWVGGYYYLKQINIQTKNIEEYKGVHSINTIAEKDSTHLWIGCTDGLFLLNKKNKHYKKIKLPTESNRINVLYQSNDGTLYIGTNSSGLLIYSPKTNKFTVYNIDNSSILSNSIYSILSDGKGVALVLSTENSLSRFDIRNRSFTNWTADQGLSSCHFNASSGTYTSKNTFIIGSGNGAIEIKADTHMPKDFSSKLVFSDFRLLYQSANSGEKNSPLSKDIDDTQIINLRFNQNIFSLRLSSINYDYPSNILYSWKLDGFYNEWTKASPESLVRYTNLIPGNYKLSIRAISKEDNHIIEERELSIIIRPSFWATIWAMIIYICVSVLLGWVALRYLFMKKERKASGDKINFFVNTAHDIRTPLTLIKAPLDDLQENEKLSFRGSQNLQMAIRSANNLYGLISNLIDFEKVDVYSDTMHLTEFELQAYIKDIASQFEPHAESKKIKLNYECSFSYQNVCFDKNKMDAILKNIIINAIKYTPENGYVNIYASLNKDSWNIEIKDTGIGIPPKEQKKIFHQIFRASNVVNSNITGSGIGLMLVHKLVLLHDGKITLNSIENEGTTFKLSFPLSNEKKTGNVFKVGIKKREKIKSVILNSSAQPSVSVNDPVYQEELPKANILFSRIVIVEDNDDLRAYLKDSLSENYSVYTAKNGKEGLDVIKAIKPDLVISDIMMPIMDGEELCRILKNDLDISHIPIILLTAKATPKDIIHGLEANADRYLTKPFEPPILRATIKNILENQERLKKRFAQMDIEETDHKNCNSLLDFQFMAKVNNIIDQNINEPNFSVDTLASKLNMSRTSCYNKIKALTNQTPSDCIREARLNKAAKILKTKQNSITEVADSVGFGDAKYFREVFKKKFGVSPRQYADGELAPTNESTEKAKE